MGTSPSTHRHQNMTNSSNGKSSPASEFSSHSHQIFPKCSQCNSRVLLGTRQCSHCNREFCVECWQQQHPSQPSRSSEPRGQSLSWCRACTVLDGPMKNFSELMSLKVNELREFLEKHSISTAQCSGKEELVDLILERFTQQSRAPNHSEDVQRMAVLISKCLFMRESFSFSHSNSMYINSFTRSAYVLLRVQVPNSRFHLTKVFLRRRLQNPLRVRFFVLQFRHLYLATFHGLTFLPDPLQQISLPQLPPNPNDNPIRRLLRSRQFPLPLQLVQRQQRPVRQPAVHLRLRRAVRVQLSRRQRMLIARRTPATVLHREALAEAEVEAAVFMSAAARRASGARCQATNECCSRMWRTRRRCRA